MTQNKDDMTKEFKIKDDILPLHYLFIYVQEEYQWLLRQQHQQECGHSGLGSHHESGVPGGKWVDNLMNTVHLN